jgi:hypothetical protein
MYVELSFDENFSSLDIGRWFSPATKCPFELAFVIKQNKSVFMFRKVNFGQEFAQDRKSGLRFGRRSLVLYEISQLRF